MSQSRTHRHSIIAITVAAGIALGSLTACTSVATMLGRGPRRPAPAEFGLGPRASAQGRYVAVLKPAEPLRPRRLQAIEVALLDAEGRPVGDARITIGGGMPQHGHGLPTRPRVTKQLGGGAYLIEGVRFNMGGWWEFKLAIEGQPGADTVTFNLAL